MNSVEHIGYWKSVWLRFKRQPWGICGLIILSLFVLVALYAPFLSSSLPLCVVYDNQLFFPLFRYLVSSSFFTKKIDLFFNLLGLFFVPFLLTFFVEKTRRLWLQLAFGALCIALFFLFGFYWTIDPALSKELNVRRQSAYLELTADHSDLFHKRRRQVLPSWTFDLQYMNRYAILQLVVRQKNLELQHERLAGIMTHGAPYTLYQIQKEQEDETIQNLKKALQRGKKSYLASLEQERELTRQLQKSPSEFMALEKRLRLLQEENSAYEELENRLQYIVDKRKWLQEQMKKITFMLMPPIRQFHWEEDAGGEQALNLHLPFYEQTRTTRKDLVAALIFGSRISLFVGFVSTLISLAIGVFLGLVCGYYGGKVDIVLSRFVEVWESLPAFFMLLFIVTIMQTKSIFLIIAVIALFSWTQGLRFVRAEVFRQRELAYVDASKALGFSDARILYSHILPNALLAVLALLPFDIMSAITREAGLAFLGLGEEQSCSWGVLMDEGRAAFPAESSLLWPPAIVLTVLLVAIAFVGEALQRAMNPKTQA